jgi:hypothetical protein
MQPTRQKSVPRQVVLGLVIGTAIAAFPIEISFIGGCLALVYLLVRKYRIALAVAVLVCVVAVQLPLNRYDRKVGPLSYPAMPVSALAAELKSDWDIFVMVDPVIASNVVSLSVPEKTSRREVLQQLAVLSNSGLKFRSCGSTASLLFGPYRAAILTQPAVATSAKTE